MTAQLSRSFSILLLLLSPALAHRATPHKMVVYDFDRTISDYHVWRELRSVYGLDCLSDDVLESIPDDIWVRWFGGFGRMRRLAEHFQKLHEASVDLRVLSKGYSVEVKFALKKLGVLALFSSVVGRDNSYALTRYGQPPRVLGLGRATSRFKKHIQIRKWEEEDDLSPSEVLFVDDSRAGVRAAKEAGVSATLLLPGPLAQMTLEQIESFVNK